MLLPRPARWVAPLALLLCAVARVGAYQVLVTEQDEVRQVCSGMWAHREQEPFIEVIFSPSSRGQLALVVFEWEDAKYLGVDPDGKIAENDWSVNRTYICTLAAQQAGACTTSDLGRFLLSPSNPANSSIFTTSVRFDAVSSAPVNKADKDLGTGPYRYAVDRKGYYCVGAVPVTLEAAKINATYTGVVDFENAFIGHLPASEYPKVAFYRNIFFVYLAFAVAWSALCYLHRDSLLPLQRFITLVVLFLVVEQLTVWRYWNALNNGIHEGVAGAYLLFVSALNAGRNSVALYLLCLASMGLSIVRADLGPVLAKVRLLALCHFVFGLLYSLGTVSIPLEAAGLFVFFFVLPLAFSLTAFLLWIVYSLSSTIADLSNRRQAYKKKMFVRLYYILVTASALIFLFFIASSSAFSARLSPSFPAQTWPTRWLLLDGWLSLLFALTFFSVAFLWRPTGGANRGLSLHEEIPGSENEADVYDVDALLPDRDREDAGELGESYSLRRMSRDETVFEVGSEDEENEESDDDERHGRKRWSGNGERGEEDEHRGLIGGEDDFDITKQHAQGQRSGGSDAPPEYRSTYKGD